jgi:FKBP-type peptidyl-prolyl cis-trans isomerase SlyD
MPNLNRVEKNEKITISYVLKDTNGRVIEEIPPTHPVVYIHGLSEFVPQGLQKALEGLKIGQRAIVPLVFADAYGPYQNDLVLEVPKEELKEVGQLWVGMEIEMVQDEFENMENWKAPDDPADLFRDDEPDEPSLFVIREIREKSVILDGNHPLAGMDLTFEVQVVAIEQPSVHELEQGYPDQPPEDDEPGNDHGWGGSEFGDGRHWR